MKLSLQQVQNLELKMQLRQVLTPMMIQSLKLLNMPYQDLFDRIRQESEENMVIEVEGQDDLVSYFRDNSDHISPLRVPDEERFSYLDKVASSGQSLHDHLMVQLELEYLEEPDFLIAKRIIENINEKGLLEGFPALKGQLMDHFDVPDNRVKSMLARVQSFEPAGIAARNVKESLLLQIKAFAFEEDSLQELLERIVEDYLQELAQKDYETIALELDVDVEDIELAADFIQTNLHPLPADGYAVRRDVIDVVPSFEIRKVDGEFVFMNLEKDKGVRINFNRKYLDMLASPSTDEKTREFLREKLASAKKLLEMLNRRHQMLDQLGELLLDRQQQYFEKGIHYLMPISQKQIASQLEVHPSTISRAIASKYIITPVGVLPLKYLCPREVSGFAVDRIKYMLKDLLEVNPGLSDFKIAKQLENFGVFIKRRTVTKYRHSLRLGTSYQRGE